MTVVDPHALDMDRWLTGVPLSRLLRIHLRIWLEQYSMTAATALALALGMVSTVIAVSTMSATVTAAAVTHRFASAAQTYVLVWLAIGAVAGTAPFRSRWAVMALSLASRRLRWLAACYGSVLVWALAATAASTVAAGIAAAVALGHNDRPVSAALGTVTCPWQLAIAVSVNVTVGFYLGAATRGTAVTLVAVYVALPLTVVGWGESGPWIDLDAARNAISHLSSAPHGLAPMVSTICLWVVLPCGSRRRTAAPVRHKMNSRGQNGEIVRVRPGTELSGLVPGRPRAIWNRPGAMTGRRESARRFLLPVLIGWSMAVDLHHSPVRLAGAGGGGFARPRQMAHLGLIGLHERVRLAGGTLTTGPSADCFVVCALLPIATTPAPHAEPVPQSGDTTGRRKKAPT